MALLVLAGIAVATLVSEDATAVATGIAVGEGHLRLIPSVAACAAGIYIGDAGLWVAGRALLLVGIVVGLRHAAPGQKVGAPPGEAAYLKVCAPSGGRRTWRIRFERARRWEFWPAWLFNIPVVVWVGILALRHRSLTLFTLANPGIEDGGFVGESKSAILAQLPQEWVLPWALVGPDNLDARLRALRATMEARRWTFPLVLKPDVGQRGAGVRWVAGEHEARQYFASVDGPVIAQVPHEGPFEAGLFYVRLPSERSGRLFSITDKRFPAVVGDGRSTLGALVLGHHRYRLQWRVFQARLGGRWSEVPARGRRVALARAGNHCQGTEFVNGQWLATPALERRIDAIAQQVAGFHFGRFDVRYRSRERFMAGEDLAIVELNGVTSEATHIYEPGASLVEGWQTLMRQWSIAFTIGAEHRDRGLRPTRLLLLARSVWTFSYRRRVPTVSD